MKVPEDPRDVLSAVRVKILPKINFGRKFPVILFRDPHPDIVEITSRQKSVDLICIHKTDLVPYEMIAEVDDIEGVKLRVVSKGRKEQLIVGQNELESENRVRESAVEHRIKFPQPSLHGIVIILL